MTESIVERAPQTILTSPGSTKLPIRKRKTHNKSRKGCGNCKLRRVKCDEKRPQCLRCRDYGVSCDYDHDSSDLQLTADGTFNLVLGPAGHQLSINKTMLSMINAPFSHKSTSTASPASTTFQLGEKDLKLLHMFQSRTVRTIGTESTWPIFRTELMKLASSHDFLMHIVLTMTLMHDRFLTSQMNSKRSISEAYHYYRGTHLFNQALSQPLDRSQRDALWAASALLGAITFCHVETNDPAEVWPLRSTSENDLNWLKMSDGKKEVWKLITPDSNDSVWRFYTAFPASELYTTLTTDPTLEEEELRNRLPANFYNLFVSPSETYASHDLAENPYHTQLSILARILDMVCNHSTIMYFLTFTSTMQMPFRQLLEKKDARAMLIVAYWHAKLCTYGQWWLWRRSLMECQSICIYLDEKYTGSYAADIKPLLEWPRSMCGLSTAFGAETSFHWNKTWISSF